MIFREEGGKLCLADTQVSTIGELIDLLSVPPTKEGHVFRIFFLPKIYEEGNQEGGVISKCAQPLAEALRVDPWFLEQKAYDSNGFFMSQTHRRENGISIQSDVSRFLIKFLKKEHSEGQDDRPDYGWLFLSFCAIGFNYSDESQNSYFLVCFDDCSKIKNDIKSAFEGYLWTLLVRNLLSVHEALLRQIIWQYDRALWLFRDPIRKIEKGRQQFSKGLNTNEGLTMSNRTGVMRRYDDMHEYARHVIHSSETLQAASAVANKLIDHFSIQEMTNQHGVSELKNVLNGLHFSSRFLTNLKLRADAFKERLDNEIQLSYNVVSLYQLQDTKRLLEQTQGLLQQSRGILEQTRDDGRDMTRAVTSLSLLFLPASFAASFWGMEFIVLKEDTSKIEFSTDLWMFFVSAILLVLFSILIWVSLHYLGWDPSFRAGNIFRFNRVKKGSSTTIEISTNNDSHAEGNLGKAE